MKKLRKIKQGIKKIIKKLKKTVPVYIPILNGNYLTGKTILVTGSTSGIGFEISKEILLNGGNVILTGRNSEKLEKTYAELMKIDIQNKEKRIYRFLFDNTEISQFDSLFTNILKNIDNKKIDGLVNNAGVVGGTFGNLNEADYDKIMDTNLKGTFFLSQLVAKYMKDNNIKGNILNIASSSSLRPANSAYHLSKWGIRGFTLGLAKTLIPYGITVNGIAPGPTATPMLLEDISDITLKSSPIQRYATAVEIANMAVILMSDIGKTIVGDIVYMTGGAGIITYDDVQYAF